MCMGISTETAHALSLYNLKLAKFFLVYDIYDIPQQNRKKLLYYSSMLSKEVIRFLVTWIFYDEQLTKKKIMYGS